MGCFSFLELRVMSWFARLWHGCAREGPDPLPTEGPVLVVANHASHADPGFLLATCSRPLCFLQARECYEVPLLRGLYRLAGCIPVSRDRPDLSAMRAALRCLEQGGAVCVFPEGEVCPAGPGRLGRGKHGAALLALRSGAPVIPAFIAGGPQTRNMLRAWLWPSAGVRVRFGSPIDLSDWYGRPINHHALEEVTARLMRQIADLRPRDAVAPSSLSGAARGPGHRRHAICRASHRQTLILT